jgi:hypothetical protein
MIFYVYTFVDEYLQGRLLRGERWRLYYLNYPQHPKQHPMLLNWNNFLDLQFEKMHYSRSLPAATITVP